MSINTIMLSSNYINNVLYHVPQWSTLSHLICPISRMSDSEEKELEKRGRKPPEGQRLPMEAAQRFKT
jgi:hypothetical protein